jgi:uncharacterized protein
MAREIFVDTGAWLALTDRRDQMHIIASQALPVLIKRWSALVTTNLVIAETYNLIRRRLGHAPAIQFLESLAGVPMLIKIYSSATIESEAQAILRRYVDQDFSFVDAVSFAVMRERTITEAFAFDHHFLIAGFVLQPDHVN